MSQKILFVTSGPSGVGKKRIMENIRLYCNLNIIPASFNKITLYYTREIRPNEEDGVDYHYTYLTNKEQKSSEVKNKKIVASLHKRDELAKFQLKKVQDSELFVFSLGQELQAIDLEVINKDVNFLEIHTRFFDKLQQNRSFQAKNFKIIRIFISPITKNMLLHEARDQQKTLEEIARQEVEKRLKERIKIDLSREEPEELERRVRESSRGLLEVLNNGKNYDAILINPYGEGDKVWGLSHSLPVGGGKEVIDNLCQIIKANI